MCCTACLCKKASRYEVDVLYSGVVECHAVTALMCIVISQCKAQACVVVLILKSRTTRTKMTCSGIDLMGYAIAV